jgi:23S rRNA pseudouridine1911/1915/1917 synthase
MPELTHNVTEVDAGKRLDVFISEVQGISRTKAKEQITSGGVLHNGSIATKASQALREGDVIECIAVTQSAIPPVEEALEEESLFPLVRIVHETEEYIVVEKPAGMLTHPTEAKEPYTLADWLVAHDRRIALVGENPSRPGIVHRLDKAASGLLVVAKTQEMFFHLKSQFQNRTVEKEYIVLVHGTIEEEDGVIDFSIDRGRDGRMVSRPKVKEVTLQNVDKIQPGKDALTEFRVLERYYHYTLLRVKIHTGRTHQIRVHMHAYGHPVVGDSLYYQKQYIRKKAKKLDRLFLHATTLCFAPDSSGEKQCFEAPLPEALDRFLTVAQPCV